MNEALRHTVWLAAGLVFLALAAHAQPQFRNVERIVAFGDVHGGHDELVRLLQGSGVLDADLHWRAGATHLVSLGDLVDRGPRSRDVLDLMMRLEGEAAAAGGRVHVVLGNHELMNLTGDSRYLTEADWNAWPEEADDPARLQAMERQPEGQPLDAPTGYFAWRAAFAPGGTYGDWLTKRPPMVAINDTLFVHGGVSPLVAELGGLTLNDRFADELARLLALGTELRATGALAWNVDLLHPGEGADPRLLELAASPAFGPDGPLWYRGNCWCPALLELPGLATTLAAVGVKRVVVGHTPTPAREATARLGGALIMLDTGMLASYYRGRSVALVIEGGRERVVGDDGGERPLLNQGPDIDPPGWTDAELETALASQPVAVEGAVATFRRGERSIAARFTAGNGDQVAAEIAAYRVDRLLGMGMVPVTVAGTLAGAKGTFAVEDGRWVDEAARLERNLVFENWCVGAHPFQLVTTFDALIANTRTAQSVAYDFATGRIRLTGHGSAFGTRRLEAFDAASVPAPMVDALQKLDAGALENVLARRQVSALLKRRDIITGQR